MDAPPTEDSFVVRLASEVALWEREGLIRPDTARMVLARYGLVEGETAGSLRRSRMVGALAIMGAILLGVGVVLLIGANWDGMPKLSRMAVLLVPLIASYVGGFTLSRIRGTLPVLGEALMFLGSLLVGASIFLIGQMYSTGGAGGEESALLYWFAAIAPVAYILRSNLQMMLTLTVGVVWFFMRAEFGEDRVFLVPFLGGLLIAVGCLHGRVPAVSRLQPAFRIFGVVLTLIGLYIYSFEGAWHGFWESGGPWGPSPSPELPVWLTAATVIASAVSLLVGQKSPNTRDRWEPWAALAVPLLIWSVAGIGYGAGGGVATLATNLILLAACVGSVWLGWSRNESGFVNLGLTFFAVLVFTRYFDLVGSMAGAGLTFVGAGALLLVGGYVLERSRRTLIASMHGRSVR